MSYCINCGEELSPNAKFCANCGASVGAAPAQTSTAGVESANSYAGSGAGPADANRNQITDADYRYDADWAYEGTAAPTPSGKSPAAGQSNKNSGKGNPKKGAWMGILALVIAIISFFTYKALSILTAIAALALGIVALVQKRKLKGFAIAALIITALSIWGIVEDYSQAGKKADKTVEQSVSDDSAETDYVKAGELGKKSDGKSENEKDSENKKDSGNGQDTEKEKEQDDMDSLVASMVDPDLKEFLDSYEAFMDDYCDFMVKYTKNPADLSLLSDYTKIMTRYEDFAEAVDAYDTDKMTEADALYYLEVVNRCNEKMLKTLGTMGE